MNKSTGAILSWSLDVTCPYCDQDTDLSNVDEDGIYSISIFNNKWDDLKGQEVECPECGGMFEINSVEC